MDADTPVRAVIYINTTPVICSLRNLITVTSTGSRIQRGPCKYFHGSPSSVGARERYFSGHIMHEGCSAKGHLGTSQIIMRVAENSFTLRSDCFSWISWSSWISSVGSLSSVGSVASVGLLGSVGSVGSPGLVDLISSVGSVGPVGSVGSVGSVRWLIQLIYLVQSVDSERIRPF